MPAKRLCTTNFLIRASLLGSIALIGTGPAWADDRTKIEGKFELTYEHSRRARLAAGQGDDISKLVPEVSVEIEHEFSNNINGVAEIELGHDRVLDHGWQVNGDHETALDLKQLYLQIDKIGPGFALTIGRQSFKDARKWYVDEDLDGLRLTFEKDDWNFEAAATRELLFKKNLLESTPDEDAINNYFLRAGYRLNDANDLNAYVLVRDGMSGVDEELTYFGLSARGDWGEQINYWSDFAYLRGRDGADHLSGFGVDLGATYRMDLAYQPSFTLAYAMGSGGDHGDDGFRQSGLEGNEHRFGGVEDFRYYGEALDPELSNIKILTAGFGVRPTEKSSIDLTLHRYWQDVATDGRLSGAAVRASTNGNSKDLGTGINLIFGYREIEDIDLGLRLGWFKPGDAFDDQRSMFTVQAGLDYSF